MLEEWTIEDLKRLGAVYVRRGTLDRAAGLKTELLRRLQDPTQASDVTDISMLLNDLTEGKPSKQYEFASKLAPMFSFFKKTA